LLAFLRRESLAKRLGYQFRIAATLARRPAPASRSRPPPLVRWTRKAQGSVAAIKYAHPGHDHHQQHHPEPQRPGDRGAMNRGELYRYYERQGLLAVYFALYPGG
jgi:hypothetical protein